MMARIKDKGLHPLDQRNWLQEDFDREHKLGREEMKHEVLNKLNEYYGWMPHPVFDSLHQDIKQL
tara:strand:+ start:981 stop:1175 length:195 start_codon:yes stop_codon:yes gene_type:complete